MQNDKYKHIMPSNAVHNIVEKMQQSAIYSVVRPQLTSISPVTGKLLTPEHLAEVFTQAGIDAGEAGKTDRDNPYRHLIHLTEFGVMLRCAWLRGWEAGRYTWTQNEKNKR